MPWERPKESEGFSRRLVSEDAQAPGAYWLCRHNTGALTKPVALYRAVDGGCQDGEERLFVACRDDKEGEVWALTT